MSLEYAILGWLSTGPGSGYDLIRTMDQRWFWTAPHSQIYPRLKEMESRGLITSASRRVRGRTDKRIYTITQAGRDAVRAWSSEPTVYPPNRDSERLKLIFGDDNDIEAIATHLQAHYTYYQVRRDRLRDLLRLIEGRKHPRIEQRIEQAGPPERRELTLQLRVMAYQGDIARADQEMLWAQNCLDWLTAYEVRWGARELIDEDGWAGVAEGVDTAD